MPSPPDTWQKQQQQQHNKSTVKVTNSVTMPLVVYISIIYSSEKWQLGDKQMFCVLNLNINLILHNLHWLSYDNDETI